MAGVQQGLVGLYGLPATITFFTPSVHATATTAFADPVYEGLSLQHNGSVTRTIGVTGAVVSVLGTGEYITCTIKYKLMQTSAANALKAAYIPPQMSTAVITGMPVVNCGPFADAINTASGSRWIYEGGGSSDLSNAEPGTATITMSRYPSIPGDVAPTITS